MTGPTASQADAGEIAAGGSAGRRASGARSTPAPTPDRLLPSLPLVPRSRGRRGRGPAVLASVLAHLLLLTLVLLLLHRREAPEPSGREQSVAMVFEPSQPPARPGLPALTRPGALPQPTTPPVPEAPPTVAPPPTPAAQPPAPPAAPPAAPPPQASAAPAEPQEEVNLQPPPAPPAPALPDLPPVPAPAAPTPESPPPLLSEQDLAGTVPPPPSRQEQPPPQREAALSPPLLRPPPTHREPPARPRLARPAVPRNSFPAPMDFSFAPTPSHAAPQSIARSMLQPPAPTDSEPGLGARTAAGMLETFARAREADPGPDFMASLKAWWLAHRFYPPQAIEAGEDGDVQLSVIVDRQGRVTEVQLEGRSGSMWLDLAGQSTWRNARLLPIPDSLGRDHLTIDLTLHYVLLRR